jgi:ParB family transcriptional regulator, chromosome partitioning protein
MVTKKPKGLGRGPEALLGPKVAKAASPNAQESGRTAREPSSLALTVRAPCNV